MIEIPKWVELLQPYRAGKPISELAREKGLKKIVKLASNENPLGPSPKAVEAIKKAASEIHRYCDPAAFDLVEAIAAKYKVKPEHVICGHGTDSLLAYITHAFTEEKDELLTCKGTFIGMMVNVRKFGRRLTTIPLKDYTFDLDALLENITEWTKVIYLANPNNPTGTMFGKKQFEAFMEKVPQNILVVLDEAYTAYASELEDYPDGASYWYDNMVVTRTLSKAYGLAGLRVGFAVGPDKIIQALYKVRLPFEPNYLAQQAAIAALDDDEFLKKTVATNKNSLTVMKKTFRALDLPFVDTVANFFLLLMPSEPFAAEFFQECLNNGLIVRHVKPFGIPHGIRINSGTEDETTFAMDIIAKVYPMLLEKHAIQQPLNQA